MSGIDLLLASLPVLIVIGLLLARAQALIAVSAGIVVALVLSARFPLSGPRFSELAASLGWVTLAVAVIMLGGIVLSNLLDRAGAQGVISDWLNLASGDERRAVLLIGLGVTPFMESMIGWGAGVIVGAPLLMRTGLGATRSCAVALLGLFLCPWGTLGSGFLVIAELGGLPPDVLGRWTALFSLPVILVMGLAVYLVGIGRRGDPRILRECLLVLLSLAAALFAANAWIAPPLAGVLASAVGIAILLVLARRTGARLPAFDARVRRALAPYAVLMVLILLGVAASRIPGLEPAAPLLGNPAPWIVAALALTPRLLGLGRAAVGAACARGAAQWWPVFLVTALFLVFGVLLAANGMSAALAAAAVALGDWFSPLIPVLGAVFGYITTSNTATAAVTTPGVLEIARALGIDTGLAVGALTAAAGSAIMASPARIALAVGLSTPHSADDAAPVDVRRVVRTVVGANLAVVALLVPMTTLLGGLA
ncbi:L-lactate permease [Leucobacter weissii]|uniref:L-lactate permease n=1 Tax=Leucobacter weissii TaxID=1983706 RepID=A0A939MK33_9MICO|nr:L-lactate permease [Leucobacter weissii]MBO1902433.1 L-lactate permease [Leucobacter weissii]